MSSDIQEFECLTVDEVGKALSVTSKTVYRLVKKGELRSVRVGRALRVLRTDLIAYLRGGETQ